MRDRPSSSGTPSRCWRRAALYANEVERGRRTSGRRAAAGRGRVQRGRQRARPAGERPRPAVATTGPTAYQFLVGLNVEIRSCSPSVASSREAAAGRPPRGSSMPNRLVVAAGLSLISVAVELFLHATGTFHWQYWWWNTPFVPLIFLFGYLWFYLYAAWVYDAPDQSARWRRLGWQRDQPGDDPRVRRGVRLALTAAARVFRLPGRIRSRHALHHRCVPWRAPPYSWPPVDPVAVPRPPPRRPPAPWRQSRPRSPPSRSPLRPASGAARPERCPAHHLHGRTTTFTVAGVAVKGQTPEVPGPDAVRGDVIEIQLRNQLARRPTSTRTACTRRRSASPTTSCA